MSEQQSLIDLGLSPELLESGGDPAEMGLFDENLTPGEAANDNSKDVTRRRVARGEDPDQQIEGSPRNPFPENNNNLLKGNNQMTEIYTPLPHESPGLPIVTKNGEPVHAIPYDVPLKDRMGLSDEAANKIMKNGLPEELDMDMLDDPDMISLDALVDEENSGEEDKRIPMDSGVPEISDDAADKFLAAADRRLKREESDETGDDGFTDADEYDFTMWEEAVTRATILAADATKEDFSNDLEDDRIDYMAAVIAGGDEEVERTLAAHGY